MTRRAAIAAILACALALPAIAATPISFILGAGVAVVPLQVDCAGTWNGNTFALFSTSVDAGVGVALGAWGLQILTTVTDLSRFTLIADPNIRVVFAARGDDPEPGEHFFEFGGALSRHGLSVIGDLCFVFPVVAEVVEIDARLGLTTRFWGGTGGWLSNLDWKASCIFVDVEVRLTTP